VGIAWQRRRQQGEQTLEGHAVCLEERRCPLQLYFWSDSETNACNNREKGLTQRAAQCLDAAVHYGIVQVIEHQAWSGSSDHFDQLSF
jgi:hypothetical protein